MKLLFVDGCISQRGAESRTRRLADAFLTAFRASHEGWEVETVDVAALDLKPFTRRCLTRPGSSGARMPWWWRPLSGT